MFYHRYDDHGVGEYYGIIRGTVIGSDPTKSIEVVAESPRAWRWTPPETYTYESLALTIWTEDAGKLHAKLHVPEMVLVREGNAVPMTEHSFRELLVGPAALNAESLRTANALFYFFRSAGTGDFPSPRHHYYYFEDNETQIGGNIAHWSMGNRVPHLLICWVLIWLAALFIRVIHNFIQNDGAQSHASKSGHFGNGRPSTPIG